MALVRLEPALPPQARPRSALPTPLPLTCRTPLPHRRALRYPHAATLPSRRTGFALTGADYPDYSLEESEGGGTVELEFTVKARGEAMPRARGGVWQLTGTLRMDGVASDVTCEGTLEMRPLVRKATLVYDLAFTDDEGRACTLHGEKHTGWRNPLEGMRTLYTDVRREGSLLGRGVLTFDLRDLSPWLKSFRLAG